MGGVRSRFSNPKNAKSWLYLCYVHAYAVACCFSGEDQQDAGLCSKTVVINRTLKVSQWNIQ